MVRVDVDMFDLVAAFDHIAENIIACFVTAEIIVEADVGDGAEVAEEHRALVVCSYAIIGITFRKWATIIQNDFHVGSPMLSEFVVGFILALLRTKNNALCDKSATCTEDPVAF